MAPIAIASLETGPKEIADVLRLQAEVTNLPRVGYEGNYAFPTMQLNIAATKPADTLAGTFNVHCLRIIAHFLFQRRSSRVNSVSSPESMSTSMTRLVGTLA